jgi:hypothetical protein
MKISIEDRRVCLCCRLAQKRIETMPVDHRGAVWMNEYLQVLACASERA